MADKALQEGALEPRQSPPPTPPAPNGTTPGPAVNPLTGRPLKDSARISLGQGTVFDA